MGDTPSLPPELPPEERQDSTILIGALKARQAVLDPAPEPDPARDARILGEARRRSEQISASRSPAISGRGPAAGADVGWGLWLGWLVAVAAVAGLWFLWR